MTFAFEFLLSIASSFILAILYILAASLTWMVDDYINCPLFALELITIGESMCRSCLTSINSSP